MRWPGFQWIRPGPAPRGRTDNPQGQIPCWPQILFWVPAPMDLHCQKHCKHDGSEKAKRCGRHPVPIRQDQGEIKFDCPARRSQWGSVDDRLSGLWPRPPQILRQPAGRPQAKRPQCAGLAGAKASGIVPRRQRPRLPPDATAPTALCRARRFFRCTCGRYRQPIRDAQQGNHQGDSDRPKKICPHQKPCLSGPAGKSQSIYAVPDCRVADCLGRDSARRTRRYLLLEALSSGSGRRATTAAGYGPRRLQTRHRVCFPGCRRGTPATTPRIGAKYGDRRPRGTTTRLWRQRPAAPQCQRPVSMSPAKGRVPGCRPLRAEFHAPAARVATAPVRRQYRPHEAGQESQGGQSFRNSLGARWDGSASSTSMSSSGGRSPSHQVGMEG